jgi:hypothetical protein
MLFKYGGAALRQRVKGLLIAFFDEGDDADLDEAMRLIADFYKVKVPRISWRRQIDKGRTAALTHQDNRFELIRPRFWHLQGVCKPTPEEWSETVLHEWFHLLTWVDEERKADAFAQRWMED